MSENEIRYIDALPVDRWEEFKNLKIEAIRGDPAAFTHELTDALSQPDSDWKESLEQNLAGNHILVFVEIHGRLVGLGGVYLYQKEKFKHNASLESLYVSPEYRRQGIGKKLIEKRMELIARKDGISNVICEIFSSQTASLKLHQKLGFEIVGRTKDFICIEGKYFDGVTLQKRIG